MHEHDGDSGLAETSSDDDEAGSGTGDVVALVGTTTRVYADCLLPNGALVAAPAHLPFYPATARDTMHCRPGLDASFAILGMATLGRDVRTPLLRWLVDRAAGFGDDGLLYRRYHLYGPSSDSTPDLLGTALLLYAVCHDQLGTMSPLAERASRSLASALAVGWDAAQGTFRHYSTPGGVVRAAELSAVASALSTAGAVLGIQEWTRVADRVRPVADEAIEQTFQRPSFGDDADSSDESLFALLSLGWPFGHKGNGLKATRAAERMMMERAGAELHNGEREHRINHTRAVRPAETFWLARALAQASQQRDALRYFNLGLATADASGHLPERADQAGLSPSPRPYLMSHLLFLAAAEATGQLQRVPRSGYSGQRGP